ncbi:MAG TPA: PadR family transcriptional regulator [Chitinophagales bacterium]|jgi:PadR family transcriptional regulator PadR|nr:PadR family transcriptional regulator [Chitinophagales bacterium]HPA35378.1 PadR family transcriptional regulator [Chitinophagales bacterium]HPW86274.1 PadR family transcriptional regulator [Chitinophagales bacterium]HQD12086.1 PadR family transcriptional regulator [Chitinophagales bacterium]HQO31820.1 PadR family transcriptional regulator [Chitinophagales bacterium]
MTTTSSSAFSIENTKVQMRKGILEFCILGIISRGEVYASDILDALKSANMLVVEGTVYPLLTRLKNAGLLTYEWKESSSGPPRKYFTLTPEGQQALQELKETWNELATAANIATSTQP